MGNIQTSVKTWHLRSSSLKILKLTYKLQAQSNLYLPTANPSHHKLHVFSYEVFKLYRSPSGVATFWNRCCLLLGSKHDL